MPKKCKSCSYNPCQCKQSKCGQLYASELEKTCYGIDFGFAGCHCCKQKKCKCKIMKLCGRKCYPKSKCIPNFCTPNFNICKYSYGICVQSHRPPCLDIPKCSSTNCHVSQCQQQLYYQHPY